MEGQGYINGKLWPPVTQRGQGVNIWQAWTNVYYHVLQGLFKEHFTQKTFVYTKYSVWGLKLAIETQF